MSETPACYNFAIFLSQTKYGWVNLSLEGVWQQGVWQEAISYLGEHPLVGFIHTAIDLYGHYNNGLFQVEHQNQCTSGLMRFVLLSESGKHAISLFPSNEDRMITLALTDCFCLTESGDNFYPPKLIAETRVHFDDYLRAVYDTVCVALARQGIIGISDSWGGDRESEKAGYLPVDAMIFMAAIMTFGNMPDELSFAQEIQLLQQMLDHGKSLNDKYAKTGCDYNKCVS